MPTKKLMHLFLVLFIVLGAFPHAASAQGAASMKLGVNDALSEIEAVSIKDSYYVPLRSLAQALNWTITGQVKGIEVNGNGRKLLLAANAGTALLQDGTTVPMNTVNQNGKLLVPVRLSVYLGYSLSYVPAKYLLRVKGGTALLDDAAFAVKYADQLKPQQAAAASGGETKGKSGHTVYLTFDDGPSATTSQLLDILDKYGVKATFFMIGPHMERYPAQVKRIAANGNGLGLHGMTHLKEKFYASPAAALNEMNNDNAILRKITGKDTKVIRPPYGSKPYFTQTFRDKVLAAGYRLWDWNVDSEDWKYKENSAVIYNSVMQQVHKLKNSKTDPVILMHDQKATLLVLPQILEALKKEGYSFEVITNDLTPVNFWKDER